MSGDVSMLGRMQVALEANAAAYRRAVQSSAPGDCWDLLVLTAADEKQAEGYRRELELRERAVGPSGAFFPAIQRSLVVPDPPGRRPGSGAATLGVLQAVVQTFGLPLDELQRLRILLIHSGGASRQLPAYAPLGKIFAPLPLLRPDRQIATLFDHLYLTLAGLPERLGPGLLVVAGDVFLLFDHRHVSAPKAGVTAISMRVRAALGCEHGVFVTDARGRIAQTLHKVPTEVMRECAAVDDLGRVAIDTGLLFFDAPRTGLLARLAGCGARGKAAAQSRRGLQERHRVRMDLYEDMTAALASGTRREEYLRPLARRALRRELWRALHGIDFHAMQLDGEFLHLGTTRQFRDAMVGNTRRPAAELFQHDVLAHNEWGPQPGSRLYHSVLLGDGARAGGLAPGSVVEHSILGAPSRVGRGSVVSHVVALRRPIEVGEDLVLFQVPLRTREGAPLYTQVLCGIDDDLNGSFARGQCLFLNRPIDEWFARHGIAAEEVWPGIPAGQRTLWTARLFVATPQRDMANVAMWTARRAPGRRSLVSAWRRSVRYSMAMVLDEVDPVGLIEHRERVLAYLQSGQLIEAIGRREDRPVEQLLGHYATATAYQASEQRLNDWASVPLSDTGMALDQARVMWSIGQLLQRPDHPQPHEARRRIDGCMTLAFARVAQASEMGHQCIRVSTNGPAPLSPNVQITASAPVRLDLSGGWSDTPPYCFERGGHVVNVAINLNGQPPVRAIVRTLREPKLILESHDLGRSVQLPIHGQAMPVVDVRDPFALHRIALDMVGLLGERSPLGAKRGAAGLHVVTECRVPKGSGLGTSSILGATLLAALHTLRGQPASTGQLIEQTLLLEQRLSTGGGWQDQVGGMVGGVKSTTTAPGIPQRPVIEALALSDAQHEALEQRLVVYFSGQQRLARDILRRVEGRWLGREPAVVLLKDELKRAAAALRAALLRGQWKAVAGGIARYWQIKKELYPGSTTPMIDVLFLELRQLYLAAGLAGAGGGGFAYFFCKDARQADRLREALAEQAGRPGSLGSVYQTQINRSGLTISRG